ncbi:MAG: hypothetical protein R3358_06195 [Woeseiaceae bacterium]|nr:hypothetical protein [Woeseiaceae bacterium]
MLDRLPLQIRVPGRIENKLVDREIAGGDREQYDNAAVQVPRRASRELGVSSRFGIAPQPLRR